MKRSFIAKIPLNLPLLKGEVNTLSDFSIFSVKKCLSFTQNTSLLLKLKLFSHFGKGGLRGIYHNYAHI
jgi:hypothetical protein